MWGTRRVLIGNGEFWGNDVREEGIASKFCELHIHRLKRKPSSSISQLMTSTHYRAPHQFSSFVSLLATHPTTISDPWPPSSAH
jgi:hypothetical protein